MIPEEEEQRERPSVAEYLYDESIADIDRFGYPEEQDDYCADWYEGDDYSEGLE